MGYIVVKKPAAPIREPADRTATDYFVQWGRELCEPKARLRSYGGTCALKLFTPSGGMYMDEARGLRDALTMYLRDSSRKQNRRPTQKQLDEQIGPEFRSTLTLNRDDAAAFIKTAKWRKRKGGGVNVLYKGKWLHLCRTDLKDDVGTWTNWSSHGDPNNMSFYAKTVVYGARITDRAFFIVDSFSDG